MSQFANNVIEIDTEVKKNKHNMTITLNAKPGHSPIEFNGKCDKIVSYNDLVPYELNDEHRGFDNKESREEYDNLFNNITENGLNKPIEVWLLKDTGEYVIMGGHNRRKILNTRYCIDFPIVIGGEAENMSCDKLYAAWASDNVRINPTPIAKFHSIEKRIKHKEKSLGRMLVKEERDTIAWTIGLNPNTQGLYTKIHNLKYGYMLNGVKVAAADWAIKDLEEGEKDAKVGALWKVQLKYHKNLHNPESRDYDQMAELEEVMQKVSKDFVVGLKQYGQAMAVLDTTAFPGVFITDVCDKQHVSGAIHYMAGAYFVECFNRIDSKFTARVSIKSEPYDIYIEDEHNEIVNTVEVKNTDKKNPKWSSDSAKGGYHLLVNYSEEWNFFVSLMFVDKDVWTEYMGTWTLKLHDACVASEKTFSYAFAGRVMIEDGVYEVQKDIIDI